MHECSTYDSDVHKTACRSMAWLAVIGEGCKYARTSLNPFPLLLLTDNNQDLYKARRRPVDLRRRAPRHRGPYMDRYEAYRSRGTSRSTLDAPTAA